jgi:hypothetical protein
MFLNAVIFRQVTRFLLAALLLQSGVTAWAINKVSGDSHRIEICTSSGTKWVQTTTADGKSIPVSHDASQHCVFCNIAGTGLEFNVSDFLSFHSSQYQTVLPTCSDLVIQFLGHSKLSRAPPSLS